MSYKSKHFSKNDRLKKGTHLCNKCHRPLSNSKIQKGESECADCMQATNDRTRNASKILLERGRRWVNS